MSWPTVALREVADIERNSVKPENIMSGTRYLGLEHVESGGRIISSETVENGELASSKFSFGPRHILYGKLRPYLAKIALPDFDGVCSTDILPVLPNERIEKNYLAHFLRQSTMVDYANNLATGANLPRLNPKALAEFPIPLPPLEEQKRIAQILDQADALRRLRTRALEKLNTLGQAIFHEMFGDPAANPMRWPKQKIRDAVAKISDGPFGSNLKSSHYTNEGIRVWRLQNIGVGEVKDDDQAFVSPEHFSSLIKHECLPGDVLVGTLGDPNLRACIQPASMEVALNKADCVQIRPDEAVALSDFWLGALNHPSTLTLAHSAVLGQTRARISMGRLREIELPIPPLSLQVKYKSRMSELQNLKIKNALDKLSQNALFASLQHRAFRGEL